MHLLILDYVYLQLEYPEELREFWVEVLLLMQRMTDAEVIETVVPILRLVLMDPCYEGLRSKEGQAVLRDCGPVLQRAGLMRAS